MLTRRECLTTAGVAAATALLRNVMTAIVSAEQSTTPIDLKPSLPKTQVTFQVPALACDTHRHVFGDQAHYPFAPASSYRVGPATAEDMKILDSTLHVARVVLVQPSGYGSDNSCLLDTLKQLGSRARGVIAIDEKTTEAALDEMDRAGIRAVRTNLGGTSEEVRRNLNELGNRLRPRKWHINTAIQLASLDTLHDAFSSTSVPVVIDHFAGARASEGMQQPGFQTLLKLVEAGKVYVKLSRLSNVSTQPPDYRDVAPLAKALIAANPQRMLWGTDWPHLGGQPAGSKSTDLWPYMKYDDGAVFNQFAIWVPDAAQRNMILVENPARLYRF